jgi:acetyl esterase
MAGLISYSHKLRKVSPGGPERTASRRKAHWSGARSARRPTARGGEQIETRSRTFWLAFVVVLVAATIRSTEQKLQAAPQQQQASRAKGGERPRLTEQAVRADEHLYRKTPQGELRLHFFFPADWKATDARPAIVFFFGGAWRTGSYQAFVPQAQYFASRGLVAASADYRILTKHGTTPDKAVEDAKSAIRWVRAHADELGVDANKIIAAGGSAGGHLAAATALLEDFNATDDDASVSCKPSALVLFNPVLDLTRLPKRAPTTELDDRTRKQLSPTLYLSSSAPPTILFYGTADTFLAQGEAYIAKAKDLGVRAELYAAQGMAHGFFNHSPWTEVTAKQADEFLALLGYLKGMPSIKMPSGAPQLEKR